ncbi:MAG: HEPN domain-containing protein [Candidatus Roizmanbacteria bacterium]|nr:HEPN domain-containing protein [Candidatus Roizmanbacteria bacterium]
MKGNRNQELAHAWLSRAKDDVLWAKDSFKTKHFSGVCFLGQQAGSYAHPPVYRFMEK